MRFVIVGNGVAGIEAARAAREASPDAEITIVSEESDHFFSRTALMYVASGQLTHRDTEPFERDFYDAMRFRRVRGRATGVDVDRRALLLAGEPRELRYDRLLIACGSRPCPPPWPGGDLRGVGHFVTHTDLEWLEREVHGGPSRGGRPPNADAHVATSDPRSPYAPRAAAAEARGRLAREVAVIGGGLIGIEVIEVLLAAKRRPRFFVREEWFWPMSLDAREARWIGDRLIAHGVELHLGDRVEAILGDETGAVRAVQSTRGTFLADAVVVAIGVQPGTDWLEGSKIDRDPRTGGILVDERLSTSAPDVLAAGDCAALPGTDGGPPCPEPLWYSARDQGRVAGERLAGAEARLARGVFYNSSKLIDVEHTTVGRLDGEAWFFEESGRVRSTTRIAAAADGAVAGFNLLGRRWDHSVLIRWIEERRTLPWVVDHLPEASFDTELVPPLRIPAEARPR